MVWVRFENLDMNLETLCHPRIPPGAKKLLFIRIPSSSATTTHFFSIADDVRKMCPRERPILAIVGLQK